MKNMRILALLSLLTITIIPSIALPQNKSDMNDQPSIPSVSEIKNGLLGAVTGFGLGSTSVIFMNLAKWMAKNIPYKRCYINYVPAIIVSTILEAAALLGWEELRIYATENSESSFWTHYGTAAFTTAIGLYNKNWTLFGALFALKNAISGTHSKYDDDSSDEEIEIDEDSPIADLV